MADGDVYKPRTVAEAVTPATATLASIADAHRLMICIGAGFSMAAPTFLPAGKKLANEVHARLAAKLPHVPECDPDNLVSVADAVEPLETGIDLIRRTCLEAADFLTAAPNHAHKLLALLLLEGEVSAMSWNWDNCIERCGRGEELLTIIRDEDRIYAQGSPLLKLHGCANHPTTMLVSTSDLDEPRSWVDAELAGRLADSVVVFVGVGDVVGYTKRRVSEIKKTLGNPDHIFVVSPGIVDGWESSAWAEVLDGLPADNRIADTAEAFLESLAASLIIGLLLKVRDSAGEYAPLKAGANAVMRVVEDSAPHLVLSLGRFSRVRAKPGFPCLFSNNGRRALLALGVAMPPDQPVKVSDSRVEIAEKSIYLLVSPEDRAAGDFQREARSRLVAARNMGIATPIEFIYSGSLGPMPAPGAADILAEEEPDDIVAGATAEQPKMVPASSIIEAA